MWAVKSYQSLSGASNAHLCSCEDGTLSTTPQLDRAEIPVFIFWKIMNIKILGQHLVITNFYAKFPKGP